MRKPRPGFDGAHVSAREPGRTCVPRFEQLVGMRPLKEFLDQRVKDVTERHAIDDSKALRHVLISGPLGAGKSTAAKFICDMFELTGGPSLSGGGIAPALGAAGAALAAGLCLGARAHVPGARRVVLTARVGTMGGQ